MPKFLIIRLSSIGDIIQCMGVIGGIRHHYPDAEIHWVTRADMAQTLSIDSRIDKIWKCDKNEGFKGLKLLAKELKEEQFDYVYDAHSNLRSRVIKSTLRATFKAKPRFVVRRKERFKRFLLFKLGVNLFQWPFIGVDSFRKPLKKWGIESFDDSFEGYQFPDEIVGKYRDFVGDKTVTLVPSANWEMKRWPVGHWCSLIKLLPDHNFVVLGGPSDDFCEELHAVAPDRVINMAGRSSIMESSYIVHQSRVVVSGDTGFLHSADLFQIPTIALMGPTAFGFPARPSSEIVALDMKCRPCTKDGRGGCKDAEYQRCMTGITPQSIAQRVLNLLPIE